MSPTGSSVDPAEGLAEGTLLEADDAREMLFDEILEQLALCDLFSNTAIEPTIFPVYAHRNDAVGVAHDNCVHDLIRWLQRIKAGVLSDKSALPPLVSDAQDSSAQRNILANQIRLLPVRTIDEFDENITSIDKVIVCGSEVLQRYCETTYASDYIKNVEELWESLASESATTVKSRMEEFIHGERLKKGFHHVLTEIAFLKVRKSCLSDKHGMVPVALDGGHHLPYLSLFGNTDLTLKLKSPKSAAKHALFFKLLEQLFVGQKDLAKDLKDCYEKVVQELKLDGTGRVSKTDFHNCLNLAITRMYHQHWSIFSTAMRNGRYNSYAGKVGQYIFRVLEKTEEKERREILNWVYPMAATKMHGKYRDRRTKRLNGTCDWVIHDQKFFQWHISEASAILALSGSMGTGKSYAISRVIDWIDSSLKGSDYDEAFAYFYCIKNDGTRNISSAILRSIVRQIATGPCNRSNNDIALDDAIIKAWKKYSSDEFYETFDEWQDCLFALLKRYPRTTIVLDALDECHKDERKNVIDLFKAILSRSPSHSIVKIFVSTRAEVDLLGWLRNTPAIRMQGKNNKNDIAAFIRANIVQHSQWPSLDKNSRKYVTDTLLEKSGDMFLFAELQINNLKQRTLRGDIQDGLKNMPEELTLLYEELYLRATRWPHAKKFTERALRWVICSLRPLTSNELLFAICQDPGADHVAATNTEVTERSILELCHNLLSLDSSGCSTRHSPVWRLAHQAVAEFFEKSDCCSQARADMHYEAGQVCLMILLDTFRDTVVEHKNGPNEGAKLDMALQCPCPKAPHPKEHRSSSAKHVQFRKLLVEYAIHAWPTHVRALQHREAPGVALLSLTLQQFLGEPEKGSLAYERWLDHAYDTNRIWRGRSWSILDERNELVIQGETARLSPIGLACYLGISSIPTEWWDCSSFNWNICFAPVAIRNYFGRMWPKSQWLWSLVALACVHDEVTTLKRLLDRGAHANTIDEDQVHPITVAIRHKSLKAMRLMQNEGSLEPFEVESALASVDTRDFTSADSILILLDFGVGVNTPLRDGRTLLAVAILKGWDDLVIRRLSNGGGLHNIFSGPGFESAVEAARDRLGWTDKEQTESSWHGYVSIVRQKPFAAPRLRV